MPNRIDMLLVRPGMLLGDGAMGTQLQVRGLPLGLPSDSWSLERPEDVEAVHRAYADAGAGWAVTNTFGATSPRLRGCAGESSPRELNRAAVALARRGAMGVPILGSIGPTGACLVGEWERAYAEQVEALAAGGVDGFLVETMVRLEEGLAAVRAAARVGAGPVWATYTPNTRGDLLDGTPAEAALEFLVGAGATVIGVNCGIGPEGLLGPARRLVRAAQAPVLAAPSAGLPEICEGRARYPVGPDAFATAAIQFQEAGVRLFAGCCGVTPAHISAAAAALARP